MSFDPNRKSVTITKAAEIAGVSRRTIYNWMDHGYLDVIEVVSGTKRIYVDSLFRSSVPRRHENAQAQAGRG